MTVTTIPELLAWRAKETPNALISSGPSVLSWSDFLSLVQNLATAMKDNGFQPGSAAAIMGPTCLEWALIDQAILWAGGISVGIYSTLTSDQARHQIQDCGARWVFVGSDTEQQSAEYAQKACPSVSQLVSWHQVEAHTAETQSLQALIEKGASLRNEETSIPPNDPDATALIIYTSGTTGGPKGALITHAHCVAQARAYDEVLPLDSASDRTVSFLPMAHAIERIIGFYGRISSGIRTRFAPSLNPADVLGAIGQEKPTMFGAVPRLFEKAYEKINAQVAASSPLKQALFRWMQSVAFRTSDARSRGDDLGWRLSGEHTLANTLLFRKIRARFGGTLSAAHCGGAPLDREAQRFFHGAGLLILEGYGMTECAGVATINRESDFKLGSVGKPLPGIDIRIASDGEILIRGASVFKGYLNLPEATAKAFDNDGWLLTGDIGRLDEDGFLFITDRKKNIIVTAGGKNVAPAGIESELSRHPILGPAIIIGDKQPYITALISIDFLTAKTLASDTPIESVADAIKHPDIITAVNRAIETSNLRLARFEKIRRYRILNRELSIESGDLTPTMKLRRNQVLAEHETEIESLYATPRPSEVSEAAAPARQE
jgi:long-chain acyl-CoA synthetase